MRVSFDLKMNKIYVYLYTIQFKLKTNYNKLHKTHTFKNTKYISINSLQQSTMITNNYNIKRFKIIKICSNIFDLIKLEAICILLKKPVLCKQKDFDYTVFLFS